MNNILETLHDIVATPLRSLLTVTGIVVGIAAVIVVITIGDGNRASIQEKILAMGANLMALNMAGAANSNATFSMGMPTFIDEQRIEGLRQAIPAIEAISPVMMMSSQVKYRNQQATIEANGVYASYQRVRNIKLLAGRFFTPFEEKNQRFVALISESAALQLGVKHQDAGHIELNINGKNYTLIGITHDLISLEGSIPPQQLYIPYQRLKQEWPNIPFFDVFLTIQKGSDVNNAGEQIKRYLKRHYGRSSNGWVKGMTDMLKAEKSITAQTTLIIVGVASLSLFVGGIGIMNIMLVTVKEKTREIGIRKAVGASDRDILIQFLTEGIVLCISGGIIGVILGVASAYAAAAAMGLPVQISLYAIVIALLFSSVVGLFFSLYPALDAAKLSPVEALRNE